MMNFPLAVVLVAVLVSVRRIFRPLLLIKTKNYLSENKGLNMKEVLTISVLEKSLKDITRYAVNKNDMQLIKAICS
ncbi:hypothetical protein GBL98_13735 [Yersinia pseudotuberculosis]|nr:hypothetical protein [Yersinia pseudotuberculosis]MBO1611297.1 hypothetical protein [Yersinia pseudotuberculosis]MBO1622186.1 hypothetical protein [Yersinia pseudotuberculosis]